MPGVEAGLADRRRLLVAGDAGDRQGFAQQIGLRAAELGVAVRTSGRICRGTLEQASAARRPSLAHDVVEHGARGVGRVGGVHRAAGQAPQQKSCRSVPKASSPRSAAGPQAPGTLSSSQATFVPEK